MKSDELQLARITNDRQWQAYRKLVAQENKRRGIEAEPLPEQRPQPSAATELDLVIDRAIALWQRDRPLEKIKGMFSEISKQFQEDSQYHYYQTRTYLENTLSGAVGIVEDTLNLSPSFNPSYFVDPTDLLTDVLEVEPTEKQSAELASSQTGLIKRIASKGAEDISNIEQHIFNFCDRFRWR